MEMQNDVKRAGLKEFVCGILVLVFGMIGLAQLADRFDSNISKHAIPTVADNCGSNKNQACNQNCHRSIKGNRAKSTSNTKVV